MTVSSENSCMMDIGSSYNPDTVAEDRFYLPDHCFRQDGSYIVVPEGRSNPHRRHSHDICKEERLLVGRDQHIGLNKNREPFTQGQLGEKVERPAFQPLWKGRMLTECAVVAGQDEAPLRVQETHGAGQT